ncbi:NAD(P)-dependent oxidoreductase [Actinophytocola sediminis]
MTVTMTVAVLGLGEAGRIYGTALAEAGHRVRGHDPYADGPFHGIEKAGRARDAVADADVVLTLTSAAASRGVAESVLDHLAPGAAYLDCTSSAPRAKESVAELFAARPDVTVADVAILGPVSQLGVATPLMAAGPAAETAAGLMRPLGAGVVVLDGQVGDAMAHKLLRSVFMKGVAAAITEAVTAGRAVGMEDWIRDQIANTLAGDGQRTIDRFLRGSVLHARRRGDEMEAAAAYLTELGVDATMATATARHLRRLAQPY